MNGSILSLSTHLEVAKVLLPELHLLLHPPQLFWVEHPRQCLMRLSATFVRGCVKVEVVGHAITVHGFLDLVASCLRLLVTSQRLQAAAVAS